MDKQEVIPELNKEFKRILDEELQETIKRFRESLKIPDELLYRKFDI